ncbi:nuclear transport factor 2 family protein [Undibacterium sp. CY7W]|uniref:Nuclear transport factor 2 family protein n=1 Tax=Undibacterium rugosum TaxID=2762291 RepID=A0A923KRZ3_9BURK|nr:nuclear transport factor 2 family protein [Undibacterium rugosum]MBC3934369.1 nuclear transport factor 2 family protein [Undibacterium rugosum]
MNTSSNAPHTAQHLALVRSTYEGRNAAENAQRLRDAVTSDIRWTEAAGFPYAGTYIGWDEIQQHVFARLASEWQNYRVTIEQYFAHQDQVVAIGTYSGIYLKTGLPFSARVAHLWTLRDGRISAFEQIVDSAMVWRAMK